MFSSDKNSRQSSGGRSLFGRSKKDKGSNDAPPIPDTSNLSTFANDARLDARSHSARSSISTLDDIRRGSGHDPLNSHAGVITSIPDDCVIRSVPYDSTNGDTRPPIQIESVRAARGEARREVPPNLVGSNGTDFHQYPSWDPANPPRPPTHGSSVRTGTSRSYDTDASTLNGVNYTSSRTSSDHGSVRSNKSGHRNYAQPNASQASFPGIAGDGSLLPSHSTASARSRHDHLNAHNPSAFSSTASFSPEGFILHRPADDRVIEEEFLKLMHKRGWKSLPEQARRQMEAYPISKKWTLVHQDRLAEWQGEQKRRMTHRNTGISHANDGFAVYGRADEEGSPEWFVKKILENTITAKQLQSLAVSLRTQPIAWVKSFVEAQ